MDRKHFGTELRKAREAAGLTQLQLAQLLGLASAVSISNVEQGRNAVSIERASEMLACVRRRLAVVADDAAPPSYDERLRAALANCDDAERDILLNTAERFAKDS